MYDKYISNGKIRIKKKKYKENKEIGYKNFD